jgi:hypothetical protein
MVAMAEYTYLVLSLPRGTSRDAARQILTEHAERGGRRRYLLPTV